MKVIISGHRDIDEEELRPVLKKALERLFLRGADCLIQGMARGTDLVAAEVALELGYKVVCAIPYYGHEARRDDYKRYHAILAHPQSYRKYVKTGPYDKGALFGRNQWMVDQMTDDDIFIAVMAREDSGTGHCFRKVPDDKTRYVYNPETRAWT